ncbi:trehalose-phosphate synthase [Rhodococcus sp. MTM3W5.2]|nr:trehalose-phosphate synthase [Rhodococcus sp. MTM3W5.2]
MGSASEFVVVANRLPVDLETLPDGSTRWKRSPGGLVTALEPILRGKKGAWVGWPGVPDTDLGPIVEDGIELYPVRLSAQEVADYYEGFSNATLWPLYHDVIVKPVYDRSWWNAYVEVNRRFAESTSAAAAHGATVWIQDYQLQLVPKMLRMLRPDLTIGFFLHIPFPPVELFMQMPWRREIVEGLLGADLIGFHLPGGAQNFLYLARRLAGQPTSRGNVGVRSKLGVVQVGFRNVRVGAFPISIDSGQLDELSRKKSIRDRAKQIRKELGNPDKVMLGVDRLDYTKGIDVRLNAIRELLEEGRMDPAQNIMVQLATPAGSGSRATSRCAATSRSRSAGSTASSARSAGRWCTTCTGRSPRGAYRLLRGRRRHAGDPAPGRHEPRRQGVRGLPQRPRWGPAAERVHRRRSRIAPGLPGQPARSRRRQGRDGRGAHPGPRGGQAPDARDAPSGARARRGPLGQVVPQRAGAGFGRGRRAARRRTQGLSRPTCKRAPAPGVNPGPAPLSALG